MTRYSIHITRKRSQITNFFHSELWDHTTDEAKSEISWLYCFFCSQTPLRNIMKVMNVSLQEMHMCMVFCIKFQGSR